MSLLIDFEFVYKETAKSVEIAGTFSEWRSIKMQKEKLPNGKTVFVYRTKLAPKQYLYKFFVDYVWKIDESLPHENNNNIIKLEKFIEILFQENLRLEEKIRTQFKKTFLHKKEGQLYNPLEPLFEQKVLADVELLVNESATFKCHRAILACGSDFFKTMFTIAMKEQHQEIISIQVEDPFAFKEFVDFMYTGMVLDVSNPRTISSLAKIAHQFQVFSLMDYLVEYLLLHVDEGTCLEYMSLCELLDEEKSRVLFNECVKVAARECSTVMRQENFFNLTWETVLVILEHKELRVPNDQFISTVLIKGKYNEQKELIPFLESSRYKNKPMDVVGGMVVCFFADGTERYTEMTTYAINSFLKNTPKVLVGLLTPNETTRDKVLNNIAPNLRYRVLWKKSSEFPHFQNWNPTQYKLDIQLFAKEDGFDTIFWIDSDTITRGDCTGFLLTFASSPNLCYFVPDHVMYSTDFKSKWVKNKWSWKLIPQACLMGFKSKIIDSFFTLWKKHWNDWISPKPFATYPDPNPEFSGSEFCIEQYALGFAVNDFIEKHGELCIKLFHRSISCIESNERASGPLRVGIGSLLLGIPNNSYYNPWETLNKVSLLVSNSNVVLRYNSLTYWEVTDLKSQSYPHGTGAVVDLFGGIIIHCYNHQYQLIRKLWDFQLKQLNINQ